MLKTEWHHQTLILDGRAALVWPRRDMVIITDPHFGKEAHFRSSGIPAPAGPLESDLARLSAILDAHGATRLRILGDFYHAAAGARAKETRTALAAWRGRHAKVQIDLVRGNHDVHAGDPPPDLGIECYDDLMDGPFEFRHHPPDTVPPESPCLAGHVHPAVTLCDGATSLRCRCFLFRDRLALLPAFGSFTGSATIRPARNDRIFAINGESVVAI